MAKKRVSTPAREPKPVAVVYRCRWCSQLFTTKVPPENAPAEAWHTVNCIPHALGRGDLVALVFPGYPGLDEP